MFDVVVFEGPDMLAEFGGVSVFSVAEFSVLVPYASTHFKFPPTPMVGYNTK